MDTVGQTLPIDGQERFRAHHFSTDNGKWNESVRIFNKPHPIEDDLVIVAVGGHAYSGEHFRSMFPGADIHIYEAAHASYREFQEKWGYDRRVHLHNAILGILKPLFLLQAGSYQEWTGPRLTTLIKQQHG